MSSSSTVLPVRFPSSDSFAIPTSIIYMYHPLRHISINIERYYLARLINEVGNEKIGKCGYRVGMAAVI
jgi:hypothetical protein